jgi:hypothetical protein
MGFTIEGVTLGMNKKIVAGDEASQPFPDIGLVGALQGFEFA